MVKHTAGRWALVVLTVTLMPMAAAAQLKASPEAWMAILQRVEEQGKFTRGGSMRPSSFGVEDYSGPRDKDHDAEYVTAFGGVDESDLFHLAWVGLVSERWIILQDGTRHIDQWLFRVRVDGTGDGVSRHFLVKDPSGTFKQHEEQKTTELEVKAKFDELIARWSKK